MVMNGMKITTGDGDSKVEVSLINRDFLVRVFSIVKDGRISQGWVSHKDEKIHLKVMALAGALAERQNEMFNDQHDPDAVASAAGSAFAEVIRKIRETNAGNSRN